MTELIRDLGANDPGLLLAVGVILGAVIATLWLAICLAWDRANNTIDVLTSDGEVQS